jgi:DNA modification methylase
MATSTAARPRIERPKKNGHAKPTSILQLKPWERNPREIDKRSLEGLKNSLHDFGDLSGIVFNTALNALVCGHQRIRGLQEQYGSELEFDGDKIITPTGAEFKVRYVDWTEQKHAAACLIANNPNTQGEFNEEAAKILRELKSDPSMKDIFKQTELDQLLEDLDHEAHDLTRTKEVAPDEQSGTITPVTEPGDIYELGRHRLICGDATKWDTVRTLTGGKLVQLVFTDPPYGVSYESTSGKHDIIQGDTLRDDELLAKLLTPALKNMVKAARDDAAFYIWHATSTRRDFEQAMAAAGIDEKQYLVWIKDGFVMGRSDYQWQHEPCFYGQKYGQRAKWNDSRDQSTVWRITVKVQHVNGSEGSALALGNGLRISDGDGTEIFIQSRAPKNRRLRLVRLEQSGSFLLLPSPQAATDVWSVSRDSGADYIHPTQKPAALAMKAIRNNTEPGESVLDIFAGSGSTLIGCELTDRQCYALELSPKYCDAIVNRWTKTTGINHIKRNGKEYQWTTK